MIFTPSWPPKWNKIGSEKKSLNLGLKGKGCTYKYFKIKKKIGRGTNVMIFTPS